MIPYIFLWSSSALPALTGAKRRALILFIVALIYFVMIGWRYHVGMDWNNYTAIVERDGDKDLLTLMSGAEAGFGALVWLSGWLGGLTFLNVVSAAVFCIGLFAIANRCREPLLAITVATPYLVMVVAMSATRQSIALGIIFYLFAQWDKSRTLKRSAVIIFASLFHFSAIVNLVFVVLGSNMSGLRRFSAAVFVGLLVLAVVTYYPERLGFYSEVYVSGRRVVESSGAVFHVLLLTVPAVIYFLIRRRWIAVNGRNDLMEHLAGASIIALPALIISSTGVDRLSLFFWPCAMYVAAGFPALQRHVQGRLAIRVLICLGSLGLALMWLAFANSSFAYVPYRNSLVDVELNGDAS